MKPYPITQLSILHKPGKEPNSRTITVDLPDSVHAMAEQLGIVISIEIGQDLISLEGVFGNKRLARVAQLRMPGFSMGPSEYQDPQEACISLIEEAYNGQ